MGENELAKKPTESKAIVSNDGAFDMYLDTNKFEHGWRVANLLAKTDLVPDHYKNKPENCFIGFQMATRLEMDPIQFLQKSYIVHGKPGIEATLIIALVNTRGPFEGPIEWEFKGEGATRSCTAFAKHKITGNRCEATVTWKMVEAEGWSKKAGSKWLTLPDLMFQYRSATFLARTYCPETIMGFMAVDELRDIEGNPVPSKPAAQVSKLEERLTKTVESEVVNESAEKAANDTQESTDVNDPAEPAEPEQQPANTIMPEERWFCNDCGGVFAKPKAGHCPELACSSKNIVDRMEKK